MNEVGKSEWFGGNLDALNMYRAFVSLLHTWDDMVDKDKPLTEKQINEAFLTCLVYLPANPFYRHIQDQILPMWVIVVSGYAAANHFEREKDPHGIEIAHSLRYAAGNIIAYAIHICVGAEEAAKQIPDMWKSVFYERYDDYRKEHLDVNSK
jgi:hypothetical protein